MPAGLDMLTDRSDLYDTVIEDSDLSDRSEPGPGQALLRVDLFGFSANNITYATFGDAMGYWAFFPARDGYGRVPVWGFADVVASAVPGSPQARATSGTSRRRHTSWSPRVT